MAEGMIEIPKALLASAQSLDEVEDWLSTQDRPFVEELERIRREEDLAGKGTPLEAATNKGDIKS